MFTRKICKDILTEDAGLLDCYALIQFAEVDKLTSPHEIAAHPAFVFLPTFVRWGTSVLAIKLGRKPEELIRFETVRAKGANDQSTVEQANLLPPCYLAASVQQDKASQEPQQSPKKGADTKKNYPLGQ